MAMLKRTGQVTINGRNYLVQLVVFLMIPLLVYGTYCWMALSKALLDHCMM